MNYERVEFVKCSLSDIAEIYNYKRIPLNSRERERKKGKYPYYGASGIVDHLNDYIFEGEHVLISEDGENLRSRTTPIAFKADGRFWVNNHAHILKGKKPLINDFIVYFFQGLDLNPYVTGAVQPKLNKENLLSIPIYIPKDEAHGIRIVSILKSFDDKIEFNRRTNQTLEAIAQALFIEWFVNFNFPGASGEMQDSELGEIPKDWKVGSIGKMFEIFKESINPSLFPQKEFVQYSLPAFDDGRKPTIDKGQEILSNKFLVKDNSILVSKLNPRIPRIWPINEAGKDSICSTEFIVFIPKKAHYFSFGSNLFMYKAIIEIMKGRATGTSGSHQRVKPQDVLNIEIVIPAESVLEAFEIAIKNFYFIIAANEQQAQTLTQLRDTLLPKLMRGEISIPESGHLTTAAL